jgi:hypothetical protein
MPTKTTVRKAKRDIAMGKRPSTAASVFVEEEMERLPHRRRRSRAAKMAIAIGLSRARRAGVPVKPARRKRVTRKRAGQATRASRVSRRSAVRKGSRTRAVRTKRTATRGRRR